MGGKNSGPTTTVNTFCSKRKEPSYSISQISLSVMINMKELTHVHLIFKKIIFQTKQLKFCPSTEDEGISPVWKLLTKDQELLALVEDY